MARVGGPRNSGIQAACLALLAAGAPLRGNMARLGFADSPQAKTQRSYEAWWSELHGGGLLPCDYPDGVDDARDVPEQRQQDIEPELALYANLEKHAEWRQKNRGNKLDQIHSRLLVQMLALWTSRCMRRSLDGAAESAINSLFKP